MWSSFSHGDCFEGRRLKTASEVFDRKLWVGAHLAYFQKSKITKSFEFQHSSTS